MKLKYILDRHGNFALFSTVNTHSDMARGFYEKPVSAGFCKITGDTFNVDEGFFPISVYCFGSSVSLNLSSRDEDSEIISKKLNNPYE